MAHDSLPALVQALPAELYNEIFELTFTSQFDRTNSRTIDNNYQPPNFLQINRATRAKFAKTYYGQGSIFYVPKPLLRKFFFSIHPGYARQIAEIRVVETGLSVRQTGMILRLGEVLSMMEEEDVDRLHDSLHRTLRLDVFRVKRVRANNTVDWVNLTQVEEIHQIRR